MLKKNQDFIIRLGGDCDCGGFGQDREMNGELNEVMEEDVKASNDEPASVKLKPHDFHGQ